MAQAPVSAAEKSKVIPVRMGETLADDITEFAVRRGVLCG